MLNTYGTYLESNHNQFGFKPKHGTDMCIFMLKQIIEYYQSFASPVYLYFLDASKAFDKINLWHIFSNDELLCDHSSFLC